MATRIVENPGAREGIQFGKDWLTNLQDWRPLGRRLSDQQRKLEDNPEASMIGLGAKAEGARQAQEIAANYVPIDNGGPADAARMSKAKAKASETAGAAALNAREGTWSQLAKMKQEARMAQLAAMSASAGSVVSAYANLNVNVPYGTPMDMLTGRNRG